MSGAYLFIPLVLVGWKRREKTTWDFSSFDSIWGFINVGFICAWWKWLQTGKAAWKPAQHNHKFGNKLPLPDAFAVPFAFYGFEALQFSSSFFF